MKKVVSLVLVLSIVCILTVSAFACNPFEKFWEDYAEQVEDAAEGYADAIEDQAEDGPQSPGGFASKIGEFTRTFLGGFRFSF